jgi:hypothetical protein
MIDKIKMILSKPNSEYFCAAYLYHCIVIAILAATFSVVENTKPVISILISNDQNNFIDDTIEIPEIENFSPEVSALDDNPIAQDQSSMSIDNKIEIPSMIEFTEITKNETNLVAQIPSNLLSGVGTKLGKGTSSEQSIGGALDRLTAEIISSAENGNLHVLWLFDASISLSHQRDYIGSRFDKILSEIEFSKNHKYQIDHSIYSFGSSYTQLCEQTSDSEKLKNSVASVPLDLSGTENIFKTIYQLSSEYGKKDPRLMIVLFTDEIGDDSEWLDKAAISCRKKGTSVYAVGSPSPFGKSKAQFKYVDPDINYDQKERWVEIIQGPETLHQMILDLRTLPIDDEVLDSGYGPFGLCSLCSETGGIYFSVHPNRSDAKLSRKDISPLSSNITKFFDNDVMNRYSPDYRSVSQQNNEVNSHNIKKALVKAATIRLDISGQQTLKFRALNEGDFVNDLNKAQKFSAQIEPKINEIYQILQPTEKDINTLNDKRWLASYHLAMGRILATKVRIELYNQILAEAKTGLKKKNQKTNMWVLNHTDQFTTTNSQLNKIYKQAQYYLNHVIDTYPDTPWAYIASEEIKTPFGYEWTESYIEPPKMGSGGNNNPNPPKDDTIKKLQPKPQRKIEKI